MTHGRQDATARRQGRHGVTADPGAIAAILQPPGAAARASPPAAWRFRPIDAGAAFGGDVAGYARSLDGLVAHAERGLVEFASALESARRASGAVVGADRWAGDQWADDRRLAVSTPTGTR